MNQIILKSINVIRNKINYEYEISEDFGQYFSKEDLFCVEYSVDVSKVPESILVIPFVCNVLPIIWISNGVLSIKAIDKDFYSHLDDIKSGYKEMFPEMKFEGKIEVDEVVEHSMKCVKTASFFSGGLDATTTLLRHIDETPDLVTLWGADIALDDFEGWKNVKDHLVKTAGQYGLNYYFAKTNFRTFIKYECLDELVKDSGDSWWHGFQHGIGIIGHATPLSYLNGYKTLYIASSYDASMKGTYTCASDPIIDNNVAFAGCCTVHDAYEMTRQDKAKFVVDQGKKRHEKMNLRVCYMESRGENCCKCEKCYRTILEIISEGGNPNDFGFKWSEKNNKKCRWDMLTRITTADANVRAFYVPIQKAIRRNKSIIESASNYDWVLHLKIENFNNYFLKKLRRSLSFLKHKVLHM